MKNNFDQRSFTLIRSTFDMVTYRVEYAMNLGADKEMQSIIEEFAQSPDVDNLRIISKHGDVLYSGISSEKYLKISMLSPHIGFKDSLNEKRLYYSEATSSYIALEPIINKRECQGCHGDQNIIAYLNIESDATDAEIKFMTGMIHISMLGVFVMFVLIFGSNYIYNVFINRPLNKFLNAINNVDAGNLDFRIKHERDDEFGRLSDHFNMMLSHLKQSQKEISELNLLQLQRSDRLVTLGELTAGISHEINNYAAIIMARADFLRLAAQSDNSLDKYQEDFDVIVNQLGHLSKITREILRFSRKPGKNFKQLNLTDTIDSSIEMLSFMLDKKGISIVRNYSPEDKFWVRGDYIQLGQVFTNLIANAVDALEEDGRIVLTINSDNEKNIVEVEDNGQGMDFDTLENIFLPFFTTKDSEKGTGLGLYIVKSICDAHEVMISCESKKGVGTKFQLVFNKYGTQV